MHPLTAVPAVAAGLDAAAPLPEGWTAPWRPNSTALTPAAGAAPLPPGVRTWRHELYPGYKGKRATPPPQLADAFPLVQALLDALAVPWVSVTSVEADDVIATLAATANAAGLTAGIASPDKDFQQARKRRVGGVLAAAAAMRCGCGVCKGSAC